MHGSNKRTAKHGIGRGGRVCGGRAHHPSIHFGYCSLAIERSFGLRKMGIKVASEIDYAHQAARVWEVEDGEEDGAEEGDLQEAEHDQPREQEVAHSPAAPKRE